MSTLFEDYLNKHSEADWLAAIDKLSPGIHEVDRTAVQIWFRFYPLSLFRYLQMAEDREATMSAFRMQGSYDLKDQVDTSHHFLYGHRYWKTVKAAIEAEMQTFSGESVDLADEISQVAAMVAEKLKVDPSLVIAITAVGMMTLVQAGVEAFQAAPGEVEKPKGIMSKKPDAIVAERAKDDSQGLLGFLKTVNKEFSIRYDENSSAGKFRIMNEQELTGASANDTTQNWLEIDERRRDGVIPIECTAASCGTCWIGVLGGQEKLSDVDRRERRATKVFGYGQPDELNPFLRLACQAKAHGNATIVIPPWNGVFGKAVYKNVEVVELEPVTTSAKALREAVREATSGDQP
ncbi:MAG: 2Fe-2S iron-sulfur cluster-binding protein [Acidobacteriota bacterium]